MRNFKDVIMGDIDRTFMNAKEFSDIHKLTITGEDGKPTEIEVPCQVDDSEVIERETKASSRSDGIHTRQLIVYLRRIDLPKLPAIGRSLTLDGDLFRVVDVVDELGIVSVTLEQNRTKVGR